MTFTSEDSIAHAGTGLVLDHRAILDALSDAVIVADERAFVVYANPMTSRVLGWQPAELVGRSTIELMAPRRREEHAEHFRGWLANENLFARPIATELRHKDGHDVAIELVLALLHPSEDRTLLVASIRDLSAQHGLLEREQRLRRLELTESIAASLTGGVCAVDRDGRLTYMNAAAERMLGWSEGELLDHVMHDAIHYLRADGTHVSADECDLMVLVRAGILTTSEDDVFVCKDGTILPVAFTLSPIHAEGQVAGAVISFDARTKHHTDQHSEHDPELVELLVRAEQARVAAEEAVRVRDELLSSVSHDLKNPLATITGQAQLLQRIAGAIPGPEAERLVQRLGSIHQAAERMNRMINDLVDVAHLRIGRPLHLRYSTMDLVALARSVAAEYDARTDQHDVQVETSAEAVEIVADEPRIERVLDNLVSNAVKYSPGGGTILIRVGERDGRAEISVHDHGLGVPEDDLPKIFDRFYRGTNVTDMIAGTGIGLAGARQIVEQHGGTIDVVTREGAGSTFTVTVPKEPNA